MKSPETPVDATPLAPALDQAGLAEAFRIFSQASEELSSAYAGLQAQVATLTAELAAANGALRQQYQEKAALTERLSHLLDALPAGVILLDAEGRTVQANPAAENVFGADLSLLAWPQIEERHLSPTDTPGEYALTDKRLAVTVTPLDSAGGRIVLLHDVTETHRLRVQAERNERLAAMGEMAAQLAHQLRTPLAAALLYAGNLELPGLAEASRISIAQKTVERLKALERLIHDTLMFARGEVLGREAFVVADLVAELRHTFEPLARTRGIDFVVAADAGGERASGNRKALVGALTSLLENALQAVDAGGEIALSAQREGDQLLLAVRDNGRGIAADTLSRMFEPFFTTRAEGTGLGLAIARGVARAHGGSIDVRSEPGCGTEFMLTLPLASETADSPDTDNG
ncbi:MAG: PAS domain-containing protein [Gammaproteobacteria bacterium]|nr:PAS domain-containing protein [Gammaproteobacteria bacterium]MBU1646193.1 PAS domain-containing protein [Gammaproteobacteria bacterium]MBU1972255.1 PAS domain-containing protein [Gammaproteobacteria bacterium]